VVSCANRINNRAQWFTNINDAVRASPHPTLYAHTARYEFPVKDIEVQDIVKAGIGNEVVVRVAHLKRKGVGAQSIVANHGKIVLGARYIRHR
jgi:hypothetical protein